MPRKTVSRWRSRAFRLVVGGVWVTGLACDSNEDAPPAPGPAIINITVTPTSGTLKVGETKQFGATVSGPLAEDTTTTWLSMNASVASVSTKGLVTAVSEGVADIQARLTTNSAVRVSARVTVVR
jgi:hypothetical protein